MSKDLDKELDKDRANKIEDSGDRGLKDIDESLDISSVLEELEAATGLLNILKRMRLKREIREVEEQLNGLTS